MTNVIQFQRKTPTNMPAAAPTADLETVEARGAYSFDMLQIDEKGLVLIDACVPLHLAVEFMNLINRDGGDGGPKTPVKSNKSRSRKKAA